MSMPDARNVDVLPFPPTGGVTPSFPDKSDVSPLLIAAEAAAAEGLQTEAIKLFEKAIRLAHDECSKARASEAFSRFWLNWGNQRIAATYMQDACDLYKKCGETSKKEQLTSAYSDLLLSMTADPIPLPSARMTTLPNVEFVTQAAQKIIDESNIESLSAELTDVITQNTGADSAVLLLQDPDTDTLSIVAEKRNNTAQVFHQKGYPLNDKSALAISAVQICKETDNYVIYNAVENYPDLASTSYVQETKPKSILCAPLISKETLIGILYLENHAHANSFDHSRVSTIKLIVSLAAIALDNARLDQARKDTFQETRDLKRQLMVSQKMDSIGHLVGGVTHDFNNVINAIYGFSDLSLLELEEGLEYCDEHQLRENIESTLESAERAASLARQLLLFSRHNNQHPVILDLNHAISTLEKMLQRLIGENITLELNLEHRLNSLYADPSQIEQVIMNLVLNARDAMKDGGTITVSTRNVQNSDPVYEAHPEIPRQSMIELIVDDTGQGMSEQVQSMIFEPFFTTKEVGKGTGLGLATTLTIIKDNNGFVYCDSTEGKGTRFSIYLPTTEQNARYVEDKNDDKLPRGSERILLVDDDIVGRKVSAQLLRKLGYQITECSSAEEALTTWETSNESFDMVISDVVMEGMNGVDLSKQLQRKQSSLKVLYISGYPENYIADQGIVVPNNSLLNKPFSTSTIAKAARQLLDND